MKQDDFWNGLSEPGRFRRRHNGRTFDKSYDADRSKAYRSRNPERIKALQKAYRAEHPPDREKQKRYYRDNREARLGYYRDNREKYKGRMLAYARVHRLKKFGLSEEQFAKILERQGGGCGICGTKDWGKKGPCIDHCHKADHVRGLLCFRCNVMIGQARNSQRILANALKYLEKEVLFNGDV